MNTSTHILIVKLQKINKILLEKNDKFELSISANRVMEIQPETLILGGNMSSGFTVCVPSFGKKFAQLRQCEQFEVQENISENKASVCTNFKNFFVLLTGMKKLIFYYYEFFGSGHFFDPSNLKKWLKIDSSKKNC